MSDLPIIMSAPMIRALIREVEAPGTGKTMTRRMAFKPVRGPGTCRPSIWQRVRPGQRLWVRETWADVNCEEGPALLYRADSDLRPWEYWCAERGPDYGAGPSMNYERYPGSYSMWWSDLLAGAPDHGWRSPIHMPRWASRLTLIVTETRLERLQTITEEDARAEGVTSAPGGWWSGCDGQAAPDARSAFALLWNSLHGPDAWARNPDVVPIRFVPHLANIDSMEKAGWERET